MFWVFCKSASIPTLATTLIHNSNLTILASFHPTPRTIRRALDFIEAGVIHSHDIRGWRMSIESSAATIQPDGCRQPHGGDADPGQGAKTSIE